VQLQLVATYTALGQWFDHIADGIAVVESGGYVRVLYAARADNRLSSLTLAESVSPLPPAPSDPQIGRSAGADLVVQDNPATDRIYVFSSHDGLLRHATLGQTGQPGLTKGTLTDGGYLFGVTAIELFERGPTDLAIIAQRNAPGLKLFSITESGTVTLLSSLSDSAKSYLGDVSALTSVEVAGRSFLLAASALENGISLFEIEADGTPSFVDALGAADGLPVGGPAALQSAKIGGTQYVVVAGTLSSSLSVLRVNDMGVLFVEDHMIDDRTTRFDHVAALDMFAYAGRVFVVAAGTDAGVSVVELLPDGRLSHLLSHALETGAGIANVTGIEVTMIGTAAHILLTDARGDRIHHFAIPLNEMGRIVTATGGTTTGSALDDRLIGSTNADTLQGGAGDDFLHDGGGNDLLFGGSGADVFVFGRDESPDRIGDFQAGIDRLDVSDWGRIYTAMALNITRTPTGAVVSYGTETLTITRAGGGSLSLTDADFLF
jgi:hypothetical protein